MRYRSNPPTNGTERFNAGSRPPANLLPKSMVDLFEERDRIAGASSAAVKQCRELTDESLDLAAKAGDEKAAAVAAREGKPIPKPVAVAKLAEVRAVAARNQTAQETAFKAVTQDCNEHVSALRDATLDAAATARDEARANIERLANELANAIEDAVTAEATQDWFNSGHFYRHAQVWITDALPDTKRYGLAEHNMKPYFVSEIIRGAVLAVLEK